MSPAEISEAMVDAFDSIEEVLVDISSLGQPENAEDIRRIIVCARALAAQAPVAGAPPHATSAGQLCEQIESLLALDADGALVPHGIGGLARELLQRSADKIKTLWTLNSVLIQQSENNVRPDASTSIDNRNMELDGLGGLDCHSNSSVDVLQTVVAGVPETRDAGGWLPIETAPTTYSPPLSTVNHHAPDILGLWGKAFFCICSWGGPNNPYWIGGDNKPVPFQPTHWMPLPPAPGSAPPVDPYERAAKVCDDLNGRFYSAGMLKEAAAYIRALKEG